MKHYFDFEKLTKYLLPNKLKYLSWIFLILGIALYFVRYYLGIKPDFLELPVFVFVSQTFSTKYFAIVKNNLSEELTAFFFLLAVYLPALTKEKEENQALFRFRAESILLAFWLSLIINIIGLLFFYGFSYLWFLIINLYFIPFFYFCILKIKLHRHKIEKEELTQDE